MTSPPRDPGRCEPRVSEQANEARYASERVSLYRRKVLLGRGEPRRLAELERIADGAATRLRAATPSKETP